ncbi:MAG: hypothetical protein HN377_05475 [Alphaproteobacteria bacterium]|jgi:hypothetical protein|nr:hypothetical protein [Alphaproteobacteria bacterium]MBT7943679.1 hypothetical protein [Alphaproteobacteria bacterium]
MTSALHQITMSYSVEDDRLLLRISTTEKSEFQFWLTRRFVQVLWPALLTAIEQENASEKLALQPAAKQAVMAMEHQQSVGASDFSHKHDEDSKKLTAAPLLVVGGSVTPGKGGVTGLVLKTQAGAEIKLSLNKDLLHALCKLLINTTMKADWGLDLTVGDAAAIAMPTDETRLH